MSTEADIVTPEKLRELVTSDHKRGCQGREYGCSCGYDDDKDAMIERAAVALEQLRAELEDAYIESRNRQNMGAKEARDMRERCAKVAETFFTPNILEHVGTKRAIAAEIRSLPDSAVPSDPVIATDGKDAS